MTKKKMTCENCLRTEQECRDKKYGNINFDGVKNVCGYGRWEEAEQPKTVDSSGSTDEVDENDPYWQKYWKHFQDRSSQQIYLTTICDVDVSMYVVPISLREKRYEFVLRNANFEFVLTDLNLQGRFAIASDSRDESVKKQLIYANSYSRKYEPGDLVIDYNDEVKTFGKYGRDVIFSGYIASIQQMKAEIRVICLEKSACLRISNDHCETCHDRGVISKYTPTGDGYYKHEFEDCPQCHNKTTKLSCDTPIEGCDEHQCKTCGCNKKYEEV